MIPRAIAECPYCFVLPDRTGFIVMLGERDGVPCPACGRAMTFVVLTQDLDGPRATWNYCCITCSEPNRSSAVANQRVSSGPAEGDSAVPG